MKNRIILLAVGVMSGLCASASAEFVINEIDSDTPGTDRQEYVELKGNPGESADGLLLVAFDGSDGAITFSAPFDLTGLVADENGYLLIGSDEVPGADLVVPDAFVRNGQDAIALYRDVPSSFPVGTAATTTNLVDVLVYRATGTEDNNWSGFGSPTVYNEGEYSNAANWSLSRYPDGTGTEFLGSELTPGTANFQLSEFTVSAPFLTRLNQATAATGTSDVVTIRNIRTRPLTISSIDLATTSSNEFSLTAPEAGLPLTLKYNQTTTVGLILQDNNPTANKQYAGAINIVNDSLTSPTWSVGFGTELVRATVTAPVGAVVVNEASYNPGSTDRNNDGSTANQNDEFVELFNTTASPILIEGWEQRSTDFDGPVYHSFVFPAGATIPANGYVTVFTAGNPTGFTPGTTFTYGIPRLRNTGAFVGISDGTKLIDGIAYLGAEDTPDADAYTNTGVAIGGGGSIGRRPDGADFFRTFNPTDPTLTNRPTPNATNNDPSGISDWQMF